MFRGPSLPNATKYGKAGKDIVYERFMITSYALVPNTDKDPQADFTDHNSTKVPTKSDTGYKLDKSPIIK